MCSACSGDYENPDATQILDVEDEPTQVERLAFPKCAILTPEERLEQTIRSAALTYYHIHVSQQVSAQLGEGDPFQLLLRDEFYRRKFRLHYRTL
jgi:hypothetical protein